MIDVCNAQSLNGIRYDVWRIGVENPFAGM